MITRLQLLSVINLQLIYKDLKGPLTSLVLFHLSLSLCSKEILDPEGTPNPAPTFSTLDCTPSVEEHMSDKDRPLYQIMCWL